MIHIIHLETTTRSCSVVLSAGNVIIARKESESAYTHSESLTLFIEDVLKNAGIALNKLDAVCVSKGPGSYMGLRIGVSTAKGLCYALGKPLIAVDTLQAMALKLASHVKHETGLYCPMLDARRMEVYCALYDSFNGCVMPTVAKIIDAQSFAEELKNSPVYFFGDGAHKCKEALENNENAVFVNDYIMSAEALVPLALEKFLNKDFEDLAYFEPFYLKDFIPGVSHVKGLE